MTEPVPPKASDRLAAELRRMIMREHLLPGSPLPDEHALASAHGMSRATVREALRLLEIDGLVEARRGPKGGLRVGTPSHAHVSCMLGVLLQTRSITVGELLEARLVLEPACALLAAQEADEHGLAALEQSCDQLEQAIPVAGTGDLHAHNLAFHVGLGRACGNHVLEVLLASLHDVSMMHAGSLGFEPRAFCGSAESHREVIAAIRRGDGAAASAAAATHLYQFLDYLRRQPDRPLDQVLSIANRLPA
jgi:DNA-binding FadR family transcriptional regulator